MEQYEDTYKLISEMIRNNNCILIPIKKLDDALHICQLFPAYTLNNKAIHGEQKNLNYMKYYIFRGQENAKWIITTSLERTICRQMNISPDKLKDIADIEWDRVVNIIKNQEKKYEEIYLEKKDPEFKNLLEFIFYCQHYKFSTRMVDFTNSIFVALWFAAFSTIEENNTSAFSIWITKCNTNLNLDISRIPFFQLSHFSEIKYFDQFYSKDFSKEDYLNLYAEFLSDSGVDFEKVDIQIDEINKKYSYQFPIFGINYRKELENEQFKLLENKSGTFVHRINDYLKLKKKSESEIYNHVENKRIFRQKGLFLCTNNNKYPFYQNWTEKKAEFYQFNYRSIQEVEILFEELINFSPRMIIKLDFDPNLRHEIKNWLISLGYTDDYIYFK